jgi:hypothetical protein
VAWLTLIHPNVESYFTNCYTDPITWPPGPVLPGPVCHGTSTFQNGWIVRFSFEPQYLLIGVAIAAATYAFLVLAILSVRAIRGKEVA